MDYLVAIVATFALGVVVGYVMAVAFRGRS
jgi:hypothetical protein